MAEFLSAFTLPLAGLALLVVISILWGIARLHPMLSLAMGFVFLAVPVMQLATFDRRMFYSDGSAAGLVFFVVFAVVGLACGSLALVFLGDATARIAKGEVVTASRRRAAIAITVAIGVALAVFQAWRIQNAPPAAKREQKVLSTFDAEVKRVVKVGDAYTLSWKRRDGAPGLSLAIPATDLVPGDGAELSVGETNDGPESVALRIPVAGARFTLRRGESFVDERALAWLDANVAPGDPGLPRALWIDTRGGGWSLLGLDCGPETEKRYPALGDGLRCFVPDAPLARWVSTPFHLERVRLHVADDRQPPRCIITFRFRDRLADIKRDGACFDAANADALREGVAILDRLSRDTQAPPDAQTRLARASEAVKRCEALPRSADPVTRAEPVACEQAAREAAVALRSNPLEASRLVLRALEVQGDAGRSTARKHQDAVIAALEAAGHGQSREALWAHALRLAHIANSPANASEAQAAKVSLDLLVSQAPARLAADDPLLDKAYFALGRVGGDATRNAEIEFVKAWRVKAGNPAPETDLGLKLRFHLCRDLQSANRERETLGACADELMSGWQARVAAGKGFEMVNGEAELAAAIARMYYFYAFASQDFAVGLAGVRRVREMAATRFASQPAPGGLEPLFQDLETQLAAKMPQRPPRR